MPYKDRFCQLCSENVKGGTSDDDDGEQVESVDLRSDQSDDEGGKSRRRTRVKSAASPSSSMASPDYIRNAVLCMLCRTEGVNLPAMSDYLTAYFPVIPRAWHTAVIVSAFSAAQKVAATYGDIVVNADDDRIISAKRSLAKWTHGLSAVEPGFQLRKSDSGRESRESSTSSTQREAYSPTTNYLIERQLPVPLESQYQHQQMNKEFEQHDARVDCTEEEPHQGVISKVDQVLSTVAVTSINQLMSMPLINLDTDISVSDATTTVTLDEPNHSPEGLITDSVEVMEFQESASGGNPISGIAAEDHLATSTPVLDEPRSPHTFMDLIEIPDVDDVMRRELTRPLSVCLSPLCTPVRDTCGTVEAEPLLQLHPSPHPSLEEEPSSDITDEVPSSTKVSNNLPEEKKGVIRKKEASAVVTLPADRAADVPRKIKPVKDIAKPTTDVQKENREVEQSARKLKRSKDSLVEPAQTSDKKSRKIEPSGFKIPLKPSQERVVHSSSHHDRPTPTSTLKGKSGDYRDGRDQPSDRNRPSATDFRRPGWGSQYQRPPGFQKDRLTKDQLRWLDRMPTGWRR